LLVLPSVYAPFLVLDTDTPQLLFQSELFVGLILSFFTRSEIPRHELFIYLYTEIERDLLLFQYKVNDYDDPIPK